MVICDRHSERLTKSWWRSHNWVMTSTFFSLRNVTYPILQSEISFNVRQWKANSFLIGLIICRITIDSFFFIQYAKAVILFKTYILIFVLTPLWRFIKELVLHCRTLHDSFDGDDVGTGRLVMQGNKYTFISLDEITVFHEHRYFVRIRPFESIVIRQWWWLLRYLVTRD
jgi:hypothetical protein